MIGYDTRSRGTLGRHAKVTHSLILTAGTDSYPVPCTSLTVEADSGRVVRRFATASTPFSEQTWEQVREWANPQVTIDAGYAYPDGTIDTQRLFTGRLLDTASRRPADTIDLAFADTSSALDDQPLTADVNLAGQTTTAAISTLAADIGLTVVVAAGAPSADLTGDWTRRAGTDRHALIDSIADVAGCELLADTLGRLILRRQPTNTGPAAATFTVGPYGSVLGSASEYQRTRFANRYTLIARWRDAAGNEATAQGTATDTDPASPTRWDGPAGRRHLIDNLTDPADAASLAAAARARLYRLIGAGRGIAFTVPLTLWLDLGDRIYVQLPWGSAWDHLTQRITHDLLAGTTTIDTRRPLSTSIS